MLQRSSQGTLQISTRFYYHQPGTQLVNLLDEPADPFRRVGNHPLQTVRTDGHIERTQADIPTNLPLAHPNLLMVSS
jgi:hypothetical protein